ncbi:hypothetical protein Naga_102839g1 [Nannochloropsis gaditana]|uniref:Uncharacterized protein n=1 Tax=Nannochloropsis gaditana TaxID=72520 RepID=W7T2V3_9STRA|nr:hypothetical protein Naga_102839g1 [Nannochloropsis gaditana]
MVMALGMSPVEGLHMYFTTGKHLGDVMCGFDVDLIILPARGREGREEPVRRLRGRGKNQGQRGDKRREMLPLKSKQTVSRLT